MFIIYKENKTNSNKIISKQINKELIIYLDLVLPVNRWFKIKLFQILIKLLLWCTMNFVSYCTLTITHFVDWENRNPEL